MRTKRSRLRELARDESGAAMVEFAFVALILFTLMFGIIDFGRAFFLYNNLTNAARVGARFAATRMPNPCAEIPSIKAEAASKIREFNNSWEADPEGYVTVTCQLGTSGIVSTVTVAINDYPFQAITPLPQLQTLALGTTAIPISAVVRFEGAADAGGP